MSKTLIVLKHEFLQKVRSRVFIVMTLIGPLLISLIFIIPIFVASVNTGGVRQLAVIDSTGHLAQRMVQQAKDTVSDFLPKQFRTKVILESIAPGPNVMDSLRKLVESKALTGYIVIPANAIADSTSTAIIKLHNASDFNVVSFSKDAYLGSVRDAKLSARGIDPAFVSNIEKGVHVEVVKLEQNSESKDNGEIGIVIAFVLAVILYMSMILYGTQIMNSVIEEKTSRVVEIMASSIQPFQLLVGKVLGVGCAGLLQVGVWTLMFILLTTIGLSSASVLLGQDVMPSVSPYLFLYFLLFFVLGFLIYATLYAAIGSTAESASDVQQVAFPVTMLLVIPFILLQGVIRNPSGTWSVLLSMVPFFAPILMLGRIFTETPPWWQIVLTVIIMIGTFFGCLWVAARIYRVGILMYGKKFKPREIVKWIKYT